MEFPAKADKAPLLVINSRLYSVSYFGNENFVNVFKSCHTSNEDDLIHADLKLNHCPPVSEE